MAIRIMDLELCVDASLHFESCSLKAEFNKIFFYSAHVNQMSDAWSDIIVYVLQDEVLSENSVVKNYWRR